MLEAMTLPFMQRALIAGALVGFLASYYGVFVTQRGLAFMGEGLAHAAFGGIALGILLGANPLYLALPWTVLAAGGIVWVQHRGQVRGDSAIGIFFAVSMSLGILFLSMKRTYAGDAFSYLFGSILSVSQADLWMTAGVVVLSLFTWPLWGLWAYATFDRELAQADRLRVALLDYALSICIAIAVVAAVKVVGIVLVAAFMVIPAATARLLTRSFAAMTVCSVFLGVGGAVAGLFFSYVRDMPTGPAMVLVQAACFFAALLFARAR
ncbi:MAG TPA: metal ABC transporter permease [Candidatus Hydrogenedentes bacterium]|nr:metal ABC transporter permease [Candidatus Hydrogenedentota bacterium]HOS03974.1 metal ABC transporter permease [Candidatus Hydrogenedentota bacterium]